MILHLETIKNLSTLIAETADIVNQVWPYPLQNHLNKKQFNTIIRVMMFRIT